MTDVIHPPYQNWWHSSSNKTGLAMALALQKIHAVTTPAHTLELYSHQLFGWVLVVDDCLYSIEHDPGYREMLIHVPLLGRRREQCRVLLLGGDGAILREVLRHGFVTEVVVCEDEPALLALATELLGFDAEFSDSRVRHSLLAAPTALEAFADDDPGFDLIVCSVAPTNLQPQALAACLTDSGVCVDSDWFVLGLNQQGWYRDENGKGESLLSLAAQYATFSSIQHYYCVSPWMTGYRGFFLYTKDAHSYSAPFFDYTGSHYNAELHRAAFALPTFWPKAVAQSAASQIGAIL